MRPTFVIIIAMHLVFSHSYAQNDNLKKRKVRFAVEMGYGHGVGNLRFNHIDVRTKYEGHFFRLRTMVGYRVNQRLICGVGFGLDGYHNFTANTAPLFAYGTYALRDLPSTWVTSVTVGRAVPLATNFERGGAAGVSAGRRIARARVAWVPSIGFNVQQLRNIGYFTLDENTGLVTFYHDDLLLKTVSASVRLEF